MPQPDSYRFITEEALDAALSGLGSGSGDVTAANPFVTDNRIIRADGTAKGVQGSGVSIDDTDDMSSIRALQWTGTMRNTAATRTANITLNTSSHSSVEFIDATSGAVAVTMPSTTAAGFFYFLKKIDATANAVTITATSIDGATNYVLSAQYQYVVLISTTTSGTWNVFASGPVPAGDVTAAAAFGTDNRLLRSDGTGKGAQATGITVDDSNDITLADGSDFVAGTTTGTKIGTATTQKLGFLNATPVVQQGATIDLGTVLSGFGFRAVGTAYPITTSGAINFTGAYRTPPAVRTAAVTLTVGTSNYAHRVDATTAAFAVTLTATTAEGHRFFFIKTDATANAVTITASGINGATNYVLTTQYQWVEVMSTTVSGQWIILNEGGPALQPTKTTTATLNANDQGTTLADATSAAFTITPPATTVPGIEFTVKKIDNGLNIVTVAGTFLNPSGNITDLKLYVPNQYHRFITTTTSGTFRPLESSPVHAPVGTSTAGLPDGTIFMEY